MTGEALVERVRKLLAMAESTTNANEAEAFSAKAAALIATHRLDPDHVRDSLAHGRLGVRRIGIGRGAYVRARLALLMAVAGHHDCEVVFRTGPDGTTALVAGFETDLDVVEILYASLHVQAAAQMATLRRATPAATQRYRRSFLFGYARRIGDLLDELADAGAADRRRSGRPFGGRRDRPSDDRLPDVRARAARVKDFAAGQFGRVVSAAAPRPAQASGWRDGHDAAGRADLGRRRVGGPKALGPGR